MGIEYVALGVYVAVNVVLFKLAVRWQGMTWTQAGRDIKSWFGGR